MNRAYQAEYSRTEYQNARIDYNFAAMKYRKAKDTLRDALEDIDVMQNNDRLGNFDDAQEYIKLALYDITASHMRMRKEFADKWYGGDDDYIPDYNEAAEAASHLGSMGIG